jgi:hypothetical protein
VLRPAVRYLEKMTTHRGRKRHQAAGARRRAALGGRRRATVVGLLIVGLVGISGPVAEAKLKATEKPFLREFLAGTFGQPASASTVRCMSSRLAAGTMEDLSVDALFAEDPSQLADSIPFRRVFRVLFGCQPVEFVASLGNSLSSSSTTRTQRNCMGRTFAKRISVDEQLLTIMIRSGVNDSDFADLSDEQKVILAANLARVFRGCLPRSVANEQIDELIFELLS